MKVLLPASEVAPIIKLGGLGDVIGSLPKALEKIDVNVDVIVPFFPSAKIQDIQLYKSMEIEVPFDEKTNFVEIYKTKLPNSNVDVMLLKNDEYFNLGGHNAFLNNIQETTMFSFFDRAVVEYIKTQFNTYDLVHCNDWHTGMITHILADELEKERPATLFTVHNLMYQGIGTKELIKDLGIVPGSHPLIDWDVSDGDVNFMQQGITSSDYVSTVSPSYAQEILTPEFGGNFYELLKAREGRVSGILNGIDYSQFPRDFEIKDWKKAKREKKRHLRSKFGFKDLNGPLFAFVGRIDPYQKGIDLIYDILPELVNHETQFILLGAGDKIWEQKIKDLTQSIKYKENISFNLTFDIKLAEEIYAGSDYLIVPSKYEPCGLIQMIAMWYGTVPIVHNVGGLKDSVKEGQTGFKYDSQDAKTLINVVNKAKKDYLGQGYFSMVENCLNQSFNWEKSAQKYKELYSKVIQLRQKALE